VLIERGRRCPLSFKPYPTEKKAHINTGQEEGEERPYLVTITDRRRFTHRSTE